MRTTIEIRDELRARLLEIAARRGEKGFSRLVEIAIERFVQSEEERAAARERALQLRGALSEEAGAALAERTGELRGLWR